MRHDYDLPADWGAMTDGEKNKWFHQERARRQSFSQATAFSQQYASASERRERRERARNETRDVER